MNCMGDFPTSKSTHSPLTITTATMLRNEGINSLSSSNKTKLSKKIRKIKNKNIVIKGNWTNYEDSMVKELVSKYDRKWTYIASHLERRTPKQCRERWINHLDPNIIKKNDEWDDEEDRILVARHKKFDNQWSKFDIRGRTENCTKKHFYSTLRKLVNMKIDEAKGKRKGKGKVKDKRKIVQLTHLQEYIKTRPEYIEALKDALKNLKTSKIPSSRCTASSTMSSHSPAEVIKNILQDSSYPNDHSFNYYSNNNNYYFYNTTFVPNPNPNPNPFMQQLYNNNNPNLNDLIFMQQLYNNNNPNPNNPFMQQLYNNNNRDPNDLIFMQQLYNNNNPNPNNPFMQQLYNNINPNPNPNDLIFMQQLYNNNNPNPNNPFMQQLYNNINPNPNPNPNDLIFMQQLYNNNNPNPNPFMQQLYNNNNSNPNDLSFMQQLYNNNNHNPNPSELIFMQQLYDINTNNYYNGYISNDHNNLTMQHHNNHHTMNHYNIPMHHETIPMHYENPATHRDDYHNYPNIITGEANKENGFTYFDYLDGMMNNDSRSNDSVDYDHGGNNVMMMGYDQGVDDSTEKKDMDLYEMIFSHFSKQQAKAS